MARDETNSSRSGEHGNSEHHLHASAASLRGEQLMSRSMLTTGALIGVAALIQPELLVGMALGAGIVMASDWLPDVAGGLVRPLVKSAIKAGYAAASMTREMVAEASESVEDIFAEARAESGQER